MFFRSKPKEINYGDGIIITHDFLKKPLTVFVNKKENLNEFLEPSYTLIHGFISGNFLCKFQNCFMYIFIFFICFCIQIRNVRGSGAFMDIAHFACVFLCK